MCSMGAFAEGPHRSTRSTGTVVMDASSPASTAAPEPRLGNYWRSLGQGLFCPLAVATGPGRLSLFWRSPGGDLVWRHWEGGQWSALGSLGVPRAGGGGSSTAIPLDWQLSGCAGDGG